MLTVEEAARLMRIGRTKAYALTQQWRATGGRSGIPVVDLGDVLRVPRRVLEEMVGTPFTDDGLIERSRSAAAKVDSLAATAPVPEAGSRPQAQRRRARRSAVAGNQLRLLDGPDDGTAEP